MSKFLKVNKNLKGIWFFGLSGSGKTFMSKYLSNLINKSFIIDGDIVREYLSFDLGYNIKDRKKQLNRLYGISKICINNKYFPIVSSVLMTEYYQKILKREKILLVKVERKTKFQNIKLKNNKNVVGVDLKYEKFNSKYLINNKSFKKNILKLVK
jgi:adenylylsulfate kinase-like enzyme